MLTANLCIKAISIHKANHFGWLYATKVNLNILECMVLSFRTQFQRFAKKLYP